MIMNKYMMPILIMITGILIALFIFEVFSFFQRKSDVTSGVSEYWQNRQIIINEIIEE